MSNAQPSTLLGSVTLNKRIRKHPVWSRDQPSYGQAFMDIVMLANDRDREVVLKGVTYPTKRGQLCWSQRGLEKEWDRSGEWVSRFLTFCKDHSMIRVDANSHRTIITVINYDTYNPLVPVTEPDALADTEPVTEPERKVEAGIGKGKQEGATAEIPSDVEVRTWAQMSGVDLDYASHQRDKTMEDGNWLRNGKLADWRKRWLGFWLEDRERWMKKKSDRADRIEGEAPTPYQSEKITLAQMHV